MGCKNLKSVTLPASLKIIASGAFSRCENLESVLIPEGVEEIAEYAFSACKNLKSVTLPASLKIIASHTFYGCESLESVIIPEGVEEIAEDAFLVCKNLKRVTFPASLKIIAKGTFSWCENLESFIIPEGVKEIAEFAFYGCKNFKSVTLPASLKIIARSTFSGCESLESVIIPEGVEEIAELAFYGCKNFKSVTLPASLKIIARSTFSGCESLESVIIPEGVEEIGLNAFLGCNNLSRVLLSAKTKIAENTFPVGNDLKQICVFAFPPEDEISLDQLDQNAAKKVFLQLRRNEGLNKKVAMLDLTAADIKDNNNPYKSVWIRALSNIPSAPVSAVDSYLQQIFPCHALIYNKKTICGLSSEDRAVVSTLLLVSLWHHREGINDPTGVFSRTPAELWIMIADTLLQAVIVKIKGSKENASSAVVGVAEAGVGAGENAIVDEEQVSNNETWTVRIKSGFFKGVPAQEITEESKTSEESVHSFL